MTNFSGYVLAGGKSSRMQKNKAFLEIGDETFLARAVSTLSKVCENPIRVVLKIQQNYMTARFPPNAAAIYDATAFDSPLDGLHKALMDAVMRKKIYAVVLAVDLPFVSAEAIRRLADIAESSIKFAAVVPRQTDGRKQPLCAVYHAEICFDALQKFLDENHDSSVRAFLETISVKYVDQNDLQGKESKDIFFNVNRPADFQQIK